MGRGVLIAFRLHGRALYLAASQGSQFGIRAGEEGVEEDAA